MGRATSLTRKGQVTIPKDVRDRLGLKPFDKIEFFVEDGEARLRKARFSIAELAGILPPLDIPVEEMPAIAREEWIARYAEKNA
jgi:antitoxin PrlF